LLVKRHVTAAPKSNIHRYKFTPPDTSVRPSESSLFRLCLNHMQFKMTKHDRSNMRKHHESSSSGQEHTLSPDEFRTVTRPTMKGRILTEKKTRSSNALVNMRDVAQPKSIPPSIQSKQSIRRRKPKNEIPCIPLHRAIL
jgi:hypothetical protein